MKTLTEILRSHAGFEKVISSEKPYRRLDFSESNQDLLAQNLTETSVFSDYVFDVMLLKNQFIGIGGYDENRVIYRQRDHFTNQENPRSIHLGVDIWANAGEPIYAPLKGTVHSFAFNNNFGDYGPTIILKHELEEIEFYTLYGHLSLESLDELYEGKEFAAGEKIAAIGNFPENGDWPPHLHFQVISEVGEYKGDFPGVSNAENREYFLRICPDPNLILRINI
ncbi:peptidoglycan DD-metalloendopeptidase family protein [Dyadobacter subterraneus]|uniref:Peptidoglycan DD-metalloendopeptidase family protein n=1 Tax=Dyadobacter subterraneus TaxID=2773304 RepID=A0ABR9WNU8_9BACT|nr:peptidoglycan DD-metalloendopeptidase family protein [Dyadobacter subterraneus]MBE9466041.1 peptidoglycan DD-metalloendopeptidase family protein [Dyadobacter subterraneus]